MKTQHIIWFLIGIGLLAAMSSCNPNPPAIEGYTPSESESIQNMKNVDSCLNVAITYTKAADILDEYVSSIEAPNCSRLVLSKLQVQYLDSAAKYKKEADRLITED